jgi:diaminobutyrate-2-oxoglutarate transaminase
MRGRLEEIAAEVHGSGGPELDVRGKGMIQALDIGDGPTAKEIARVCFDAGLLVGPCGTGGRVIKLIPPLTTPDADLDEGLTILGDSVRKVLVDR